MGKSLQSNLRSLKSLLLLLRFSLPSQSLVKFQQYTDNTIYDVFRCLSLSTVFHKRHKYKETGRLWGRMILRKMNFLYLKQGVNSIKGKSKENLLLFTYYGGKFEMAKGPKIWFLTLVQPPRNEIQLREKHEYTVTLL